eukprot:91826-Amphidinium_carterae.1
MQRNQIRNILALLVPLLTLRSLVLLGSVSHSFHKQCRKIVNQAGNQEALVATRTFTTETAVAVQKYSMDTVTAAKQKVQDLRPKATPPITNTIRSPRAN